jgi:hypothetical protein
MVVRNKVSARIFSLGTSFLTVISREIYYMEGISTRSLFFYELILKNMVLLELTIINKVPA